MDRDRFKSLLVRDKEWLENLYSATSQPFRKRLLVTASDKKLDTLIRFLHLLSNGEIKMHKRNFDSLSRHHIMYLKKSFEKKAPVQRLLNSERQDKLKKLQKLLSVFPFLLYTLFNEN